MTSQITKFIIKGLFGYRDVYLDFSQPYKILIGENGLGKTTVINCLYYTLSQKFKELSKIKFSEIELHFEKEYISFTKHQLECYNQRDESSNATPFLRLLENNLQPSDLHQLDRLLFGITNDQDVITDTRRILSKRGIGVNASELYLLRNVRKVVMDYVAMGFSRNVEKLERLTDFEILYFPTYRRVESSFSAMADGLSYMKEHNPFFDDDDIRRLYHTEMIKFGMTDVKERIQTLTNEIAQQTREGFSKVLGDMLSVLARNNTKLATRQKFEESKINIVLSRLSSAINVEDKKRILEYALSDSQQESKYLDFLISRLKKGTGGRVPVSQKN